MILFKTFMIFFLIINFLQAEIPNLENRDKETIRKGIVDTYIRSMNKWDIPFQDLLENRSGSACINWNNLTEDFLKTGMFDALGYSQNIPNQKASQIAAVTGCKKMKEYYKLGDTCNCEVILTNNITEIILPVKKFDMEKEFENAVLLYKKNDYKTAMSKFEQLSDMGDAKSQYNLAVIFYKGLGTPQNFKKAYYWSMMSNLNGQKEARKLLRQEEQYAFTGEFEPLVPETPGINISIPKITEIPQELVEQKAREIIGNEMKLGLSITDISQLEKVSTCVDYLGVGPIYSTPSKEDASAPIGEEELHSIILRSSLPVVAIGGISIENTKRLFNLGVSGVAVISALLKEKNNLDLFKKFKKVAKK